MTWASVKQHDDTLRPGDAYMRHWTMSSLVQIKACRLFGAKPWSEPMMANGLQTPRKIFQWNFICILCISPCICETNYVQNGCGGPWWRHQMETFSAWLAFCAGNSLVTGKFPSQRPVTRSFDVFFDLNKPLSKKSRRQWFETQSPSLWRPGDARTQRYLCNTAYTHTMKVLTDIVTGSSASLCYNDVILV